MPRSLDVYTMLMMNAVASITMALTILFVRTQQREGLGLWALGLTVHAATYGLYALRGQVADWASIWLANVLLSCAMTLALSAISQFHHRKLPWARMLMPIPVMALGLFWLLHDYALRIMLTGSIVAVQLMFLLHALWYPDAPRGNRGALLLTLGYGLMVLLLLLRTLRTALYGASENNLMQTGSGQETIYLTAFVLVIIPTLGFILMTKERADLANRYLAEHDELTGAFNRRALIRTLERDVALAAQHGQPYALLLIDIDHFKALNDHHGHLAGDAVLRHVVQTLQARVRTQDVVGRYGGEELLVLLPHTDAQGAQHLAQQLCTALAKTQCDWHGQALQVTVSIGVFAGLMASGQDWDSMVSAADQAMYQAKQEGRNRVCLAKPGSSLI